MDCLKKIIIIKSDDTSVLRQYLLKINITSNMISFDNYTSKFVLNGIVFEFDDVKNMVVNLTSQQTSSLPSGLIYGSLYIYDNTGKQLTLTTSIPFIIKEYVSGDIDINEYVINLNVENEETDIKINVNTVADLSNINSEIDVIKQQIISIDETKANKSEIPDTSGFATKTELNGYVNTTTNQNIGGLKKFISDEIAIMNNNMQFGVAPSSRQETRISFKGRDDKPVNNITCNRYPNGSTYFEFHTHAQNGSWSQPDTCFRVGHNGSNFVAEVPTPNSNSNGRDVATTAWVVSKLGGIESALDTINGEIV